jgi:hypothetical protein
MKFEIAQLLLKLPENACYTVAGVVSRFSKIPRASPWLSGTPSPCPALTAALGLGSLGEAVKESKDKDRGRERPPKTRFEEAVEILKMLLRQEKITKADEQDAIYFCTSDECMQLEYLQVDHQFD